MLGNVKKQIVKREDDLNQLRMDFVSLQSKMF